MKKAVYPGSFDPITYGHIDIIQRMQPIFDEVIVLVSTSPQKKYLFTAKERQDMIQESLKNACPGISVDTHDGLTVEYVRAHGASVIVRGLRAVVDFEYEMVMANMNKKLAQEIETMIVFAKPEYYYISSNTIKEVTRYGADVTSLVPPPVIIALKEKNLILNKNKIF